MLLWYKKSSFVLGCSEMKGRKLPSHFYILHRSRQHRVLCSMWWSCGEAAALLLGTQPQPAVWRRQGSGIGCSICWIYLDLFKVFGMETFSFPHPASWERPEQSFSGEGRADPGSLLQRMPGLTHRVSAPASCAAGKAPALGQPSLRGQGEGQASITSGSFMGLLWCAWNFTCLSFLVIFCPAANPE